MKSTCKEVSFVSELSNIPAHAVLPLGAYSTESLRRGADRFEQEVLECDLNGAVSRQDVLTALGESFGLAQSFWRNLDALYEGIIGLPVRGDKPGLVVLLKNIPGSDKYPSAEREALLDVFRRAADYFFERETAFRVFYSINKTG
jgi:RNAse (barnase) inhibitor barstar